LRDYVIVQVYYHLGAFEDSVTYALGADKLFNVNASGEYVETIVGMGDITFFCLFFVVIVVVIVIIIAVLMMIMMMMDELTLTWHIDLRLQGHITVKKSHVIANALVDGPSRNSCMSEKKARSSVYHEKLAVITMPELTLTDCSKQMQQLPGRHGRRW